MVEGDLFSSIGGEQYARFSESGGYRVSILGMTEALLPNLRGLDHRPKILEVGGGRGRSAKALIEALGLNNLSPDIVITEPDRRLLRYADTTYPRVVNPAEVLPFVKESFDAVAGSQVVHWIVPESVPVFFYEAHRVLRPGGMLVLATSGIADLGEVNRHHFTRHSFVSEHFLPTLERLLKDNGYWDPADGRFEPRNPKVNPRYDNFTLDAYRTLLLENGFRDISIAIYMFPCNTEEMIPRLTNLASLQMHFFQGDFAKGIPDDEKVRLANIAFIQAKKKAPVLFKSFDTQRLEVTKDEFYENTFGEPIPIISAIYE